MNKVNSERETTLKKKRFSTTESIRGSFPRETKKSNRSGLSSRMTFSEVKIKTVHF